MTEFHVPPSQQSAQGPVPKPGEPVKPTKGILAEPLEPKARTESFVKGEIEGENKLPTTAKPTVVPKRGP